MIQLIYMWIENFRNIKDLNLNFHPEFEIKFKKEEKNKGKLSIEKLSNSSLNNYFPENQFINIIAGKNGTGKTSILSLIESIGNPNRYFTLTQTKQTVALQVRFFCIFKRKEEDFLFLWGASTENKSTKIGKIFKSNNQISISLPSNQIEENSKEKERMFFSNEKLKTTKQVFITSDFKYEKPPLTRYSWGENPKNYTETDTRFLRNLFKCGNLKIISEILSTDIYTKLPENLRITISDNEKKILALKQYIEEKQDSIPNIKKIENIIAQLKKSEEKIKEEGTIKHLTNFLSIRAIIENLEFFMNANEDDRLCQ